ncbi:MAG: aminotransferase class III-fold pyridoxal phosphate-dependent enzyme [Dehalococcoidia bacterium]|nr:MAG: aminotransferase class III-fold pyridoxal phosphate-dependent enzyme [Dehalococcoidia bacterium]
MRAADLAYDLDAERSRYAFPDVVRNGISLNRGTAEPAPADSEPSGFTAVREAHRAALVPSTLAADGPVVELDRPATGVFVASRRGVYLDLYQGVAQRLFDDARIAPRLAPVVDSGLLLHREINTDDYIGFPPEGVHTPQELAGLVTSEMRRAFPRPDGYRVFFSASGTEAVEAALKAATRAAYLRVRTRYGPETWATLCGELGVGRDIAFADEVWRDYPLFLVGLHGAFHGRTLGSLALTESRPAQRIGFPSWRWVVHISRNRPEEVHQVIDRRPLPELLAAPGGLQRTVAEGRVPIDLLAGAIFEPFQGEGGYHAPSVEVLSALRQVCDEAGALLIADEVQSFARGGATFFAETQGVRPDIVCLAKAAIVGMTIMPAETAAGLEHGWHSNTLGSGRLFDVNYAYAQFDTFLNERDPLFAGLSFAENEAVKGEYLAAGLTRLAEAYPSVLSEPEGGGCLWGMSVASRGDFLTEGWRQGAKLIGAGASERPGRVRLILPADVLTREIDVVLAVLGRTCAALATRS